MARFIQFSGSSIGTSKFELTDGPERRIHHKAFVIGQFLKFNDCRFPGPGRQIGLAPNKCGIESCERKRWRARKLKGRSHRRQVINGL